MSRRKRRDKIDGYEPKLKPDADPWRDHFDGFKNELTGIGDFLRDKTRGNKSGALEFENYFLTHQECASRWRGSDLGGRIIETIPDEMTREGWELSIQPSDDDAKADAFGAQPMLPPVPTNPKPLPELNEEGAEFAEAVDSVLGELDVSARFREALNYERAYGGGAVFIGADDGFDTEEPLAEDKIKEVRHLTTFTGGWDGELIAAKYYDDPTKPNYGQPEIYMLRNIGVPGAVGTQTRMVHESRLLVFSGASVSREARIRQRGWGDSVFTRVEEVLSQYSQTWGGIANLMTDFSQGVLSIKDLAQSMGGNDRAGTKNLTNRALAMNMARSISRILLIDSEETFSRDTVSLAGIAEMLQQFALRLAAAAGMPVALLMGQAPAGLNATGASDIRFFYDKIAACQRIKLEPPLKRLISLLFKSKDGPTRGAEPDKWNVRFRSLYQLSELEKADLRNKQSLTDKAYVDMGAVTPEEIAASRFGGSEYSTETVIDFEGREKMAEEDARQNEERAKAMVEMAKQVTPSVPPIKR